MLKRIGTIKKEKYMEMNKSVGTVDYLSPPKPGKDQWFMPVVLDQSGTKIKFYCKFDPQVQSRRVPKSVHELATSIFPHMSQRLKKESINLNEQNK